MKIKYILLVILTISISHTAEAQFLKKLKRKAQEAAEQTILRKTEEKVTEKTEKTIDGALEGKKTKTVDNNNEENIEPVNDSIQSTQQRVSSSTTTPLMGLNNSKVETLPEAYLFDWEFKTNMKITSKKKSDNADYIMNFFLNTDKDYYAMDVENEEIKKSR
ncbi:hypothetical protein [Snuella lapsa]|uniref:Uncharacterized protein n=1 Tax=Snuella lapsa TaxID=870481 RepID=A0ABP6Y0J0_9FLAO